MARITVEDCLKNVDNQFDLVLLAARRARSLANGAEPLIDADNDKPTVIALREIALGLITEEILDQMKEPEEDILSSEQAEELLANTPLPGMDYATKRTATSDYQMRADILKPSKPVVTAEPDIVIPTPPEAKPEPEVTPESLFNDPADKKTDD